MIITALGAIALSSGKIIFEVPNVEKLLGLTLISQCLQLERHEKVRRTFFFSLFNELVTGAKSLFDDLAVGCQFDSEAARIFV